MNLPCSFAIPVNLGTEENPDWEYSELICVDPRYELVENASTGASFYIQKTWTYGDMVLMLFLTLFFVFTITKGVFGFFWHK
jgi:hypothetical protein